MITVLAPPLPPDLPPWARGLWLPGPGELVPREALLVLVLISAQPLACGVLLGRLDPVGEV